jgi:NAD(P)-dependent dehydrogenase (short-subunit alcohol dehydrogenase family)
MLTINGKLAVVTGGGSGMGRELVAQLAAEGCSVATCDVNLETAQDSAAKALVGAPEGTRASAHACDVSDEAQVQRFRDEVVAEHAVDHVDLVFSNAGVGGGGSFITDTREQWERTFAIDWWGVYYTARAFLPLLINSPEGVLVNTSSVNGFWASLGAGIPHTAYSTAKFAVKGFSEALIEDLRVNAPHVHVAVVMPGHIGTDIVHNSRRVLRGSDTELSDEEVDTSRGEMVRRGLPVADASADQIREFVKMGGDMFRDSAPMNAAEAATVILQGVREGRWRILVGEDAKRLDEAVRANPEAAYEGKPGFGMPTLSFS